VLNAVCGEFLQRYEEATDIDNNIDLESNSVIYAGDFKITVRHFSLYLRKIPGSATIHVIDRSEMLWLTLENQQLLDHRV